MALPDHRKKEHRQEKEPFVLEARGEISPEERRLVSNLLGYLGLDSKFTPTPVFDSARANHIESIVGARLLAMAEKDSGQSKLFTNIRSPDQFMVREHFEHFRMLFPIYSKGTMARAFHLLVDGHGKGNLVNHYHGTVIRERAPLPGVEVRDRNEVGWEPYPRTLDAYGKGVELANLAVQASGVILLSERYIHTEVNMTKTEEFISVMAEQLRVQFELED